MPRRYSPAGITKRIGRSVGSAARPMFEVSGVLFNSREIESIVDRKSAVILERTGKLIRRSAMRSLKVGKRYRSIYETPDNDTWWKKFRQRYYITQWQIEQGRRPWQSLPTLPMIASKPGKLPKIKSLDSPLRKGILYSLDRTSRSVVVGVGRYARTRGKAPSVLEHGGISNGSKVAARPYMSKALQREHRKGRMKDIFRRSIK